MKERDTPVSAPLAYTNMTQLTMLHSQVSSPHTSPSESSHSPFCAAGPIPYLSQHPISFYAAISHSQSPTHTQQSAGPPGNRNLPQSQTAA